MKILAFLLLFLGLIVSFSGLTHRGPGLVSTGGDYSDHRLVWLSQSAYRRDQLGSGLVLLCIGAAIWREERQTQ